MIQRSIGIGQGDGPAQAVAAIYEGRRSQGAMAVTGRVPQTVSSSCSIKVEERSLGRALVKCPETRKPSCRGRSI